MTEKVGQIIKASIRSVATAVPVVNVFAQAWSEYDSIKSNERIDNFIQEFGNNLSTQTNHIVQEKIRDEFPILLESILEKIRREPSDAKRQHYAKLLSNSFITNGKVSLDEKLNAVESLDYLSEQDLKILKDFSGGQKIRIDELVPKSQFYQFPPEMEEHVGALIVSLQKLETRGLLAPTTGVNKLFEYLGEKTDWVNVWRSKTYVMLPFGRKFCGLIWD